MNKNILSSVSNIALTAWMLGIGIGLFFLGFWIGIHNNKDDNYEFRQTATKQEQTINDLKDTILKMKLYNKDTITSLQDPH